MTPCRFAPLSPRQRRHQNPCAHLLIGAKNQKSALDIFGSDVARTHLDEPYRGSAAAASAYLESSAPPATWIAQGTGRAFEEGLDHRWHFVAPVLAIVAISG